MFLNIICSYLFPDFCWICGCSYVLLQKN